MVRYSFVHLNVNHLCYCSAALFTSSHTASCALQESILRAAPQTFIDPLPPLTVREVAMPSDDTGVECVSKPPPPKPAPSASPAAAATAAQTPSPQKDEGKKKKPEKKGNSWTTNMAHSRVSLRALWRFHIQQNSFFFFPYWNEACLEMQPYSLCHALHFPFVGRNILNLWKWPLALVFQSDRWRFPQDPADHLQTRFSISISNIRREWTCRIYRLHLGLVIQTDQTNIWC